VKNKDITVISDYAHHPTSIQGTIESIKQLYPLRRLVVVFQPHQHDRTKKLFNRFVQALRNADVLILSEIFDVAGREEQSLEISSQDLVQALSKEFDKNKLFYCATLEQTLKKIQAIVQKGDIVLIMGAGDIYKICSQI